MKVKTTLIFSWLPSKRLLALQLVTSHLTYFSRYFFSVISRWGADQVPMLLIKTFFIVTFAASIKREFMVCLVPGKSNICSNLPAGSNSQQWCTFVTLKALARLELLFGLLTPPLSGTVKVLHLGRLQQELSLYGWLPVWLLWISLFCKFKQKLSVVISWFQTSQTGGER